MKTQKNLKTKKQLTPSFLVAATVAGILFSCAPKPAVLPTEHAITEESLAQGKTIFVNSCAICHDLPKAREHSVADWVGIMNTMAKKAKLTNEQHVMVYDYIVSQKH